MTKPVLGSVRAVGPGAWCSYDLSVLSFCFVNHTVLFQVTGCSSTRPLWTRNPFQTSLSYFSSPLPSPISPSTAFSRNSLWPGVADRVTRKRERREEKRKGKERKEKEFTVARFSSRLSSAQVSTQGDRNWASMLAVSAQTRIIPPPPLTSPHLLLASW